MLAMLCAVAALAAGLVAGTCEAGARGGVPALKRIGDFANPVYVDNAPGAKKLLFVVEQPGTVAVLRKGHKLNRPFLDISDRVTFEGEQGLLSIAFDPSYATNRRFYIYYVNGDGDIQVDSMRRKRKQPTRADSRSRHKLIVIPHPGQSNHNGGQLQFGPDGMLYFGTGDGGGAGDQPGNAQNPDVLLGKLLRIDPRKHGYGSPDDNPFASGPGRDEIFALGLRNPYRFSFDSATGDLWIGDVGQDNWEEIDHVSLADAQGANFGWNLFEGNHEFEGDANNPPPNYRPPVFEYPTGGSNCAVMGGFISHDPAVPALAGRYVYADYCGGVLRSFDPADPTGTDASTGIEYGSPSGFGEGVNGQLYATSLDGPVYRIVQR